MAGRYWHPYFAYTRAGLVEAGCTVPAFNHLAHSTGLCAAPLRGGVRPNMQVNLTLAWIISSVTTTWLVSRFSGADDMAQAPALSATGVTYRAAVSSDGDATTNRPVALRARTSGLYISSACAGGCTKLPGVVARATYEYRCSPRVR